MRCALPGRPIRVGDPMPWFSARTVTGNAFELQVSAGRWIVLCFLGSLEAPGAMDEAGSAAGAGRAVPRGSPGRPRGPADVPHDLAPLAALSGAGVQLSRRRRRRDHPTGAATSSAPWCSIRCCIAWRPSRSTIRTATPRCWRNVIGALPEVGRACRRAAVRAGADRAARVRVCLLRAARCASTRRWAAPIPASCSTRPAGRRPSIDHRLKSRRDLVIVEPTLREAIRERIVTPPRPGDRTLSSPFEATRMDRYMVSCYAADHGGHFSRHRDNVNAGARHRKFAASINLNQRLRGLRADLSGVRPAPLRRALWRRDRVLAAARCTR